MINRSGGVASRTYLCKVCEKEYRPVNWNFHYCTPACAQLAHQRRIDANRKAAAAERAARPVMEFETVKLEPLRPEELKVWQETPRPKTVAECPPAEEPCPFYGCRYHLGMFIDPNTKEVRYIEDLESMTETCALRWAEAKGQTEMPEIAQLLGVSRQAISHCLNSAYARLRIHHGHRLEPLAQGIEGRPLSGLARAAESHAFEIDSYTINAALTARFKALGWAGKGRSVLRSRKPRKLA